MIRRRSTLEPKPGNFYSRPFKVHRSRQPGTDQSGDGPEIAPATRAQKETKYVKHITDSSKLLSDFWGVSTYLGAHVLLPEGFEEHIPTPVIR